MARISTQELARGQVEGKLTQATHDEQVIALWLADKSSATAEVYHASYHQFNQLVPKPLESVTLEDLMYWRYYVRETYKVTTANKKLSTVKSLFNFACGIGYIPFNPAKVVKMIKPSHDREKMSLEASERIVSQEDVVKLIQGGKSRRDRVLLKTTYLLGLRVHEAISLHWDDVSPSPNGGYRVKIIGKNGKVRYNRINDCLYQELRSLDTEGYIFQSNRDKQLSRTMTHYIIKDAAAKAGLSDQISFHWLRHCHASHSLNNGASLKSVQQQLGHSSIAITSIYLHDDECSSDFLTMKF
jgi:integrase/recombinase XerD